MSLARSRWCPARAARALCAPALLLAVLAASGTARAQLYGPAYRVSAFEIEYALDHPRHVSIDELLDLEVGLRSTPEAYVAPRPVDRTVRMRLSSLPRNAYFSATAIQHLNQHIVSTFNRIGYHGVIVTVPEIEEGTGRDLRPPGETRLRLRIWTGRVSRVATLADGERFGGLTTDERTNNAAHEWIRERSPVQPGGARGLLDVDALEDYSEEISRHPGRRADVELEPGGATGSTAVTLRIAESKPWFVYGQYSNTGTEATTLNRERFGFVHNQLTGRDDILSVDYTTGDFDSPNSVIASYDSPFTPGFQKLRFNVRGWWSEYDASTVGFSNGRFQGEQAMGQGSIRYNVWQDRALFVDVEAGARIQQMFVENFQFGDSTRATYLVPQIAISGERNTLTSSLLFGADIDVGLTNQTKNELALLGNEDPDETFVTLRFDASWSFYLEPVINRQAWEDPTTPGSSTLAHEMAFLVRGQWAFGNRLVPQYQQIAGGLYTVRGYEQAEVAGDNLLLGSAEYRLHVPRLFWPDDTPPEVPGMGAFRARPQHVWGRPDWDFIVRVFTDAAGVTNSDRKSTETDELLWSAGLGVELQLLRNISVRLDGGWVLSKARESDVGDARANLVGTLLY